MPSRPRTLPALLAILVAGPLAACGGGGTPLTADAYRAAADAVCARTNTALGALDGPADDGTDAVLAYIRDGLEVNDEEIAALRDLEPPAELADAHGAVVATLEEGQELVRAAQKRIASGERPTEVLDDITAEGEALQATARERARALGLTVCGREADAAARAASEAPPVAPPDSDPPEARFAQDVADAAAALGEFAASLEGGTSLADYQPRVPEATASLEAFDSAVASIDGYTLSSEALETRRAALVRTGPEVSAALRGFLAEIEGGDMSAVLARVPGIGIRIRAFQDAAAG